MNTSLAMWRRFQISILLVLILHQGWLKLVIYNFKVILSKSLIKIFIFCSLVFRQRAGTGFAIVRRSLFGVAVKSDVATVALRSRRVVLASLEKAGNTKWGKYHCTIDLLFDLSRLGSFEIKTKLDSCHRADSKPVKQEVKLV